MYQNAGKSNFKQVWSPIGGATVYTSLCKKNIKNLQDKLFGMT